MTRSVFALVSVVLAGSAAAASSAHLAPAHPLPKLLTEVEAKYSKSKTLEADFSQIEDTVATGRKKPSSGKIAIKRPNKLRWETLKPDPNLLVSDGRTFWFYTPPFDEGEQGQLVERKSSEVNSKILNALLTGTFSAAQKTSGVQVAQLKPDEFEFKFKRGTAGTIERAILTVDPSKKLIEKAVLLHKGGNRTEISLSNIHLGGELADELFRFKAPPGTERQSG